jgi:exosortase
MGGMDSSKDLRADRFLRIAICMVVALAFWPLILWDPTWELRPLDAWLFLPTDPLPQIIFLLAAALVFRRRESFRCAMRSQGSLVAAALPLLVGLSLFVWGLYVDAMDLVLVSFMSVSVGIGSLWYGGPFVRAMVFPLVVLAFAFPAPAVVTNQAFYALRLWTASHSAGLLELAGIPVLREGNVIFGSNVIAQVVDTCSGLRSMEILTLAAVFFTGWFPARRWRQLLLIFLAPAIAYTFNLIRICVIAVDPTSEFSAAHTAQGLTVFLGAITALILVDRIFGWLFPAPSPPTPMPARGAEDAAPESSDSESGMGSESAGTEEAPEATRHLAAVPHSACRVTDVALAAIAVVMVGVSIWMPRWSAPIDDKTPTASLPGEVGAWAKRESIKIDNGFLWTVRFLRSDYQLYERGGDEVSVFIGVDDRTRRSRSLISRKNGVPRRGFQVLERDRIAIESIDAPVERVVARSRAATALAYYWYEGVDGIWSEIGRTLLALDQSPFRRTEPARVIRITTGQGAGPIARAEAEARLRDFALSLEAARRE